MKVKDLAALIPDLDPESEIYVTGGHTDYATSDVEVVEHHGEVMIQEAVRIHADHYQIVATPDTINDYDKLAIYKSYMCSVSELEMCLSVIS